MWVWTRQTFLPEISFIYAEISFYFMRKFAFKNANVYLIFFFQQWYTSVLNAMLRMVKFPVCFVTCALFTKQLEGSRVKNVIIRHQEKITFVDT